MWLRIPKKNGEFDWMPKRISDWKFHPTRRDSVDVAVLQFLPPTATTLKHLGPEHVATADVMRHLDVGIGDEVFITGLFKPRGLLARSVPILRMGAIAGMDEEPVPTKDFGKMAAYLIEVRSIGGISGSPVFFRRLFHERFYFLGIIHGHYDTLDQTPDNIEQDTIGGRGINTGIAIVVPAYYVVEVVGQFSEAEKQYARQLAAEEFLRKQLSDLSLQASPPIIASSGTSFEGMKFTVDLDEPTHFETSVLYGLSK